MPNLYGVAQPNPPPVVIGTIGGADVNCPAGVETNVASAPAPLPSAPGVYYPAIWGWLVITFGATAPGIVIVAMRVNGGADLTQWQLNNYVYTAGATVTYPFAYYANTFVQSYPLGSFNLQVSVNATAQAVTIRTIGTVFFGQWFRATDQ